MDDKALKRLKHYAEGYFDEAPQPGLNLRYFYARGFVLIIKFLIALVDQQIENGRTLANIYDWQQNGH